MHRTLLPRASRALRSALLFTLVTLACAGARPRAADAQVAPADSAAVLLDAASRFAAQDRHDVAEALYRFILERFPGTPAAEVARLRLGTVVASGAAGGGRVELQVWTTLYGLWLGVAVPGAFGAEGSEPYGLGLLLGGPGGFLAGKAIAGSRDLTVGQARAITLGGTWGTWQGLGWAMVMDLGAEEVCYDNPWGRDCYDEGDSSEENFAAMILGGAAGIAVGAALSARDISPGVATTANFGALWGTWLGFGTGFLLDMEDDALLAASLLGGNAGLAYTALRAPAWNVSRSRARMVSIHGVIGGLSGVGLDLLLRPDDDKVAMAIPLVGSLVGLGAGVARTRGYEGGDRSAGIPGGALVNVSGGEWSLGAPVPSLRIVEAEGPRGTLGRPALGIPLLSARF